MNLPRVSSYYDVSGTKTFRLASRAILSRYGTNLQNWEKSLRKLIIPDDGYMFMQPDLAGAETVVVALLCRQGNLRDLIKYKIKAHNYVALNVFKQQWEGLFPDNDTVSASIASPIATLNEVPRWKELQELIKSSDGWDSKRRYYFMAKKLGHASNYGMGADRFRLALLEETGGAISLPLDEATIMLKNYHNLFPEIREWHRRTYAEVKRNKVLRNLFQFPFRITGFVSEREMKEMYAWVPQSTVGTITNIAYTKMYDYIEREKKDWMLLANTHDSFLLQIPPSEQEEAKVKAQEFLCVTLKSPVDGVEFKMKSDVQVGYNWGPWHETKNPNGLKEL